MWQVQKKKTKTGRIIMEKTEEVCGVSGTQILCVEAKEKKSGQRNKPKNKKALASFVIC